MNFIWFLFASILFSLFFWYVLSMLIFLPTLPIQGALVYLTEHPEKKWTRIALVPTFILGFLLGTLLPCMIYGMGMGWIASHFAEGAPLSFIYYILGGIGAFTIAAPSGETSLLGMFISLVAYIITVAVNTVSLFTENVLGNVIGFLSGLFWVGLVLLVLAGIVWGLISFLDKKVSRRATLVHHEGPPKRLSVGVYIVSTLSILLGGSWVLGFFLNPSLQTSAFLIWGAPMLVGGIGMLGRKYWALRLNQVCLILAVVSGLAYVPFYIVEEGDSGILGILSVILMYIVFSIAVFGLPIWFLFRKATVRQFIGRREPGIPVDAGPAVQ